MTFAIANLAPNGNTSKPLTGAGTATLVGAPGTWTYATNDTVAVVNAANYFADAVRHLNLYDIIFAACDLDGTPVVTIFYVNAIDKSAGTIDVTNGTDVTPTDTN